MAQPVLPKIIDSLLKNGSEPGAFPFPVYYYTLDTQKYYFQTISYSFVCVSMTVVVTIATDTMYIMFILHNCGVFAALGWAEFD